MSKVFYDPHTLQIKGHSTGELSMGFPFVETEFDLALMSNFKIEKRGDDIAVVAIDSSFTDEQWAEIMKV